MAASTFSLRLPRIAGVEIRLDWSLLVVFWLILLNVGGGLTSASSPASSPALAWAMGAAAGVLFILSVLAHELSHALVGRAHGVPVGEITLFIFGGVTQARREPPSPRAEVLMTIVGPLTSLAIGLVALVIAELLVAAHVASGTALDAGDALRVFKTAGPLAAVLLWLGPVNLMLAAFNLIPAFPLDGGRMLRAALWALTRDLERATREAARVGQVFGLALVLVGLGMLFGLRVPMFGQGQGIVGGLWIALIGWMVNTAAATSYSQVVIQDLLRGVPVSQLMQTDAATVVPRLMLSDFVDQYLMRTDRHAFPVLGGEALVGIVTMDDVRRTPRDDWARTSVAEVMTPASALVVAAADEDTSSALEKMARRNVEQLPVVRQGRLFGLLRHRDILRWLELQPPPAPPSPRRWPRWWPPHRTPATHRG